MARLTWVILRDFFWGQEGPGGLRMYPKIQIDLCDHCGLCVEICPSEVYQMNQDAVQIVLPEECIECGACVKQCPSECLALVDD